jgi:hypothetical protein
MRHLVVLYLALASVLVIGPNPLWPLPLLLVSASYITGNRYLGIGGMVGFFAVTLGRMPAQSFFDMGQLSLMVAGIVVPGVIALDMALSERPYQFFKPRPAPVAITALLAAGLIGGIVVLSRLQRIGVYLGSDPVLQVFMVIALSVLFTGPVLLTKGPPGKGQV